MELEGSEIPHTLVFVNEVVVVVQGQHGGNITMCAAISENGVSTHILNIGPYNTQNLSTFFGHPLHRSYS